MKRQTARLLGIFVTGLVAALPLAATVTVFWWLWLLLLRWLGPQSGIGAALSALGLGVTGSELAGYAIGVAIVLALIFGLGLLVEAGLQHGLQRAIERVLERIPLVRNVYDTSRRLVDLMSRRPAEGGSRSMSAVWCHFGGLPEPGGPGRVAVLALLSTPEPVWIGERAYLAVIVPTAPVPVGGGLLYLPREWVEPAEVGFEALTSIYVSMGLSSPQYLRRTQG